MAVEYNGNYSLCLKNFFRPKGQKSCLQVDVDFSFIVFAIKVPIPINAMPVLKLTIKENF